MVPIATRRRRDSPTRRVIAYHLLWQDDVNGSWIPFTVPTDEEVVWVGYDSTRAPTDIWTYWHGTLLHADWRERGQVAIDVQWGKHGSLPHGLDRVRSSLDQEAERLLRVHLAQPARHLARESDAAGPVVLLPRLPRGIVTSRDSSLYPGRLDPGRAAEDRA